MTHPIINSNLNKPPTVSVVIPTYNRETLLQKAIQSVINQNYSDFELIIVDDCSTDNTSLIVQQFLFSDVRIKYLRHERNRGGPAARNTGIRASTGSFIAFLDSDDSWFPEKLEIQMAIFLSAPEEVGLIYTGFRVVDYTGNELQNRTADALTAANFRQALLHKNCIGMLTAIVRRSCFDQVGYFDETLPSCQDWDMWLRIARSYHIDYVSEVLANRLEHTDPNRISNSPTAVLLGYEQIAEKHLEKPSPSYKHIRSTHYFSLGSHFIKHANLSYARRCFQKAFLLYPLRFQYGFYWLATFFGLPVFHKLEPATSRILSLHLKATKP